MTTQLQDQRTIPSLRPQFTSVAHGNTTVIASQKSYAELSPIERQTLDKAGTKILVITPADALVKTADGKVDRDATKNNLHQLTSHYFPGRTNKLTDSDLSALTSYLTDIDQSTGMTTATRMPNGACVIQMKPDNNSRFEFRSGLPESMVRPEVAARFNRTDHEFALLHEENHCHVAASWNDESAALDYAHGMQWEAKADASGLERMARGKPDRQAQIESVRDVLAIESMLKGNHTTIGSDEPLHLNDHATSVFLMRPNTSPMAAMAGNDLANSAIYHMLGEDEIQRKTLGGVSMDHFKQMRDQGNFSYDASVEERGNAVAQESPLQHYAAAKALRDTGSLDKNSAAYLYVDSYVEAMERTVKPDLIKDAQVDVAHYEDSIHARQEAGYTARTTINSADETLLANSLLNDRRNARYPQPLPELVPPPPPPPDMPAPR